MWISMYFFAAVRLEGLKSVIGPGIEGGHCWSRVVSCGDGATLILRGGKLSSISAERKGLCTQFGDRRGQGLGANPTGDLSGHSIPSIDSKLLTRHLFQASGW